MAAQRKEEWAESTTYQSQSISKPFRDFIPSEQGESIQEQISPWDMNGIKEDMESPLHLHAGDPQTMWNIIQMMSVELQHWQDYHVMASDVPSEEFRKILNQLARAEHVHHLKLMSLLPKPHDPSEDVLLGEAALIDAYHMCIRQEQNDVVKSAFEHIVKDHVQHGSFAANRIQSLGCDVKTMAGGIDLNNGRPIDQQFMPTNDMFWQGSMNGAYDKTTVDPMTLVNVDMALAGEIAAWNVYHCAMANTAEEDIKLNYAAFQSIEDQHIGILGSLIDPSETTLERSLCHEQVEIRNYQRLMQTESNQQVRELFADLYKEDLEQARMLGQLVQ